MGYYNGTPLSEDAALARCADLATLVCEMRLLGGKVHGSLARAGKVKGQTPKVDKQEKKKSYPSQAACKALIGSTSEIMTRHPKPLKDCADPLPTSPYPATKATFPPNMTSVALLIPSQRDSRQPYKLSNLDLVTESFTLIAGTLSSPFLNILYKLWTSVVVSSDKPLMPASKSGCSL